MFGSINSFNSLKPLLSTSIASSYSFTTTDQHIKAWYNPSNVTVSSGTVSAWNDSTNTINLTSVYNTAYITKSTYTDGTTPVIYFSNSTTNGSGLYNNSTSYNANAIIFVAKVTNLADGFSTVFSTNLTPNVRYAGYFVSGGSLNTDDIIYSTTGTTGGSVYINGTSYKSTSSNTVTGYNFLNSYAIMYVSFRSDYLTTTFTNLTMSSSGGSFREFNGYMGDYILFNTSHTSTDREKIEGYLGYKYGLQSSLPTTHTYYSSTNSLEVLLTVS